MKWRRTRKSSSAHCPLVLTTSERGVNGTACAAVNAVGSEQRTHAQLKKKWSAIKVDVKRRTAAHHQSVDKTGGGTSAEGLTPFEERVTAIMGDIALSGAVGAHVGDSDYPQGEDTQSQPSATCSGDSSTRPWCHRRGGFVHCSWHLLCHPQHLRRSYAPTIGCCCLPDWLCPHPWCVGVTRRRDWDQKFGTMRVHVHPRFCFLCVLTFLYHQSSHCHGNGHHQQHRGHHHANHTHNDLQISEAPYVRRPTPTAEFTHHKEGSLKEEQHFYIQQLFRRYGKKDRLDFQGFKSLLVSLGLGKVKVVDMDHDNLGHDHVAHLDILDVQEGLHTHGETRGNVHHSPGTHQPHTEQGPTQCSQHTTAASTPPGASREHPHKHNHDHNHTHSHMHDADHRPDHAEEDDGEHSEHAQMNTDMAPTNLEHQSSAQTDTPHIPQDLLSSTAPTDAKPKRPRKPGKVRGQRGQNKTLSPPTALSDNHDHKNGVDHGHDYSHKDKREAPGGPNTATVPGPILSGHAGGLSHQHEECLNLTQLLTYYGLSPNSLISPSQFTYLCPALLYQIDSRVCIRHYHQMDVEQEALENVNSVWTWVWGFVSITIISLLSLLGVILVPILDQSCFKFLLTFLVALAVGTLSGDALLHLLPHSQGQHDHSDVSHGTDLVTDFDGVWKGLTALAGIYLLFIFEHCIGMFKHYKDQRSAKNASQEGKIGRKLSDHKLNRRSDAEWVHLKALGDDPDTSAVSCDNDHNDTQFTELQTPDSPTNKTPLKPADAHRSPAKVNGHKVKQHSHGHSHSHGGNCHSDQEMKDAGIASIAWMVIMGDGMHNFSDGLAIGAAFSANLTGGISTSVAVFCHELPHELGDFAVLLKAGMSVKQAIVYNLLSALMAYVGMLIGTAVGQYTHSVTSWIFAVTAGMFLYVALVDMLPELLHGDSEVHKRCQLGHFILQNLGMLTGFGIMLLIAIFEDRIVFDFGF
ncbi:zinc transporter ZIP10 isoform X2 [Phyllopteryx taeniolatus]|uniref:zinc transporter ZIP10 isoform X2 n=1 Tax=Phyllopteryx taeniolatus TaxID=161469 RepID=UPI002AD4E893|nr:zinc transporter ZIP10 isoform X2 [Phyllopteryx taeniolatus]